MLNPKDLDEQEVMDGELAEEFESGLGDDEEDEDENKKGESV